MMLKKRVLKMRDSRVCVWLENINRVGVGRGKRKQREGKRKDEREGKE